MSFFDGCPGSKRIKEPFPENIKCACGKEIEIWSDETETIIERRLICFVINANKQ
jgi:hypothetical protein